MPVKVMISKSLGLLGLFAMSLGTATYGQTPTPNDQEQPLRLTDSVSSIISDLESWVPEYMQTEAIPGVAIALIRDGETIWTEGFGVKNTITAESVTPETVFEVASNSKIVTAYIALRLVDQGIIALDEPLNTYLPEPWLPPSEYREAITLRRVLSHTSGLSHSTTSRENLFAPGRGYSYSAIGFQYLQVVIEQLTGQSLEEVAREMVFKPLGMSSSSFVNREDLTSRTASGHVHALVPVVLFTVLYLIFLIVARLVWILILRVRTGKWRPTGRGVMGLLATTYCLSMLPLFILLSLSGLTEFAWLIAITGLVLALVLALSIFAGRVLINRLIPARRWMRVASSIVWNTLTVVGLILLASNITNVPVPKWPAAKVQAAGSMRATAGDMAAFMIELSSPRYLGAEMAAELRASQVSLGRDLSWGLGPGIQHSPEGDILWQWGQHVDFQSLVMIYADQGFGVVVCTNNDLLNSEVALEIAQRALGGMINPVRQGMRLQFNYREGL